MNVQKEKELLLKRLDDLYSKAISDRMIPTAFAIACKRYEVQCITPNHYTAEVIQQTLHRDDLFEIPWE